MRKILPAILLALATILPAAPALSGAWPRGAGKHFNSTGLRIDERATPGRPRLAYTVYHEYGVTDRLTAVAEADHGGRTLSKALAFAQWTLTDPATTWQVSMAAGGGLQDEDRLLQARLLVGRGLTIRGKGGWVDALAAVLSNLDTGRHAAKLDLTLGWSPTERAKTYVQVFAYAAEDAPVYLRAEASVAWNLWRDTWLDVGASTGITPNRDRRYRVGIWTSF